MNMNLDEVRFDADGLVPVVVQDSVTNQVLMLGYASRETLRESQEVNRMVFFSRSRGMRWLKGETSGNYLNLVSLELDCDADAVLARVQPVGPTCHTGSISCFGSHD